MNARGTPLREPRGIILDSAPWTSDACVFDETSTHADMAFQWMPLRALAVCLFHFHFHYSRHYLFRDALRCIPSAQQTQQPLKQPPAPPLSRALLFSSSFFFKKAFSFTKKKIEIRGPTCCASALDRVFSLGA